jgi:hypothetical protein
MARSYCGRLAEVAARLLKALAFSEQGIPA